LKNFPTINTPRIIKAKAELESQLHIAQSVDDTIWYTKNHDLKDAKDAGINLPNILDKVITQFTQGDLPIINGIYIQPLP